MHLPLFLGCVSELMSPRGRKQKLFFDLNDLNSITLTRPVVMTHQSFHFYIFGFKFEDCILFERPIILFHSLAASLN